MASFVYSSVTDIAGNLAEDKLPPLGNPELQKIREHTDLGSWKTFDAVSENGTDLSFDPETISVLPSTLEILSHGQAYSLFWQFSNNYTVLSGLYSDDTGDHAAFQFKLSGYDSGIAEIISYTAFRHPDNYGSNSISFQIPYLKTNELGHKSLAGLHVLVENDLPAAIDRPIVQLIEGTTTSSVSNGNLFSDSDTGADGARITAIDGIETDHFIRESSGSYSGYYKISASYGDFYFLTNGEWGFSAFNDQENPNGAALEQRFHFTLTDYDQDSSIASITFQILDGDPVTSENIHLTVNQECQGTPTPDSQTIIYVKGSDTIVEDSLQFLPQETLNEFKILFQERVVTSSGDALDLVSLYPDLHNRTLSLKTINGDTVIRFWLDNISTADNGDVSASIFVLQKANLSVLSEPGKSDNIVLPVLTLATEMNDDQAINTALVTMIDGLLEAINDTGSVVEGSHISGNLITDMPGADTLCSHSVKLSRISMDGEYLLSGSDSHQFTVPSNISTSKGQLTVQENGDWLFSSVDGLNHQHTQQLDYGYTITAVDGHQSSALASFRITDGNAPSGGFSGSVDITEGNLTGFTQYPITSSSALILVAGNGSDPIAESSLEFSTGIDVLLQGKLIASGTPVVFSSAGKILTGMAAEKEVIRIELVTDVQTDKDLPFQTVVTLFSPVDHFASRTNQLQLNLPVTATDIDGSAILTDGMISLRINDGNSPQFQAASDITLYESGLIQNAYLNERGSIQLVPGSDSISTTSWQFSDQQASLINLTSLGQPVSFTISPDAQTIECRNTISNELVLALHLENAPLPLSESSLEWSAILYQPMDQNTGIWPLRLHVGVRDFDDDSNSTELYLNIINDAPIAVDHSTVSVIEGQTGSSEQSGKLFNAIQAGADQAIVSAVNHQALDNNNLMTSGAFNAYHLIPGTYGSFYVKPPGEWIYQATENLIHIGGTPFNDIFTFTLTDSDGDPSQADIAFSVEDGQPPAFNPASAPVGAQTISPTPESGVLMSINIDQECDPPPTPDSGLIIVDRGSDDLLGDQLQFDIIKTREQLKSALSARSPVSNGEAIDLDDLYPGINDQSFQLKTVSGLPVLTVTLVNISHDSAGNLHAAIEINQSTSFDSSGTEPVILPIKLNVSDHDDDTISTTINLIMIDGKPQAVDDHNDIIEGTSVSGNLLSNDRVCMDPLVIKEFKLNASDTLVSGSGAQKTYLPGHWINTLQGQLLIENNGDWQFNSMDSLHNNPSPITFQFVYVSRDTSGDESSAAQSIIIRDGAAPQGNNPGPLTISEGNLVSKPGYPVHTVSGLSDYYR